jgi:FkbM family methyltransferase
LTAGMLSRLAGAVPDRTFVRVLAWQYRLAEPELRHLRELVPPGRPTIDVGAWWGPWSWWLARRAPSVHAFEPNPMIAPALVDVLPPNVCVHAQAVSDHVGKAVLTIPQVGRGMEGRSSLLPATGTTITVPTVTLDSLDLRDVGFVKIDVEGHEWEVLEGATELLARDRPNVLLEVEHQFHTQGPSVDDTFRVLQDQNYVGWFLLDGKWHPLHQFDLNAHQLKYEGHVQHAGLLGNMLFNARRYVNNFAFIPAESAESFAHRVRADDQ